jgi:hypothetical protein
MSNLLSFRSLARSNVPVHHKETLFSKFLGSGGHAHAAMRRVGDHGVAAVSVIRQYGEAGITGLALAAIEVHAKNGLDYDGKFPIDFGAALILGGIAVANPGEDFATSARNIGAIAGGIYAFREGGKFLATKKKTSASGSAAGTAAGDDDAEWSRPSMTGEAGVDPLVELAARL